MWLSCALQSTRPELKAFQHVGPTKNSIKEERNPTQIIDTYPHISAFCVRSTAAFMLYEEDELFLWWEEDIDVQCMSLPTSPYLTKWCGELAWLTSPKVESVTLAFTLTWAWRSSRTPCLHRRISTHVQSFPHEWKMKSKNRLLTTLLPLTLANKKALEDLTNSFKLTGGLP